MRGRGQGLRHARRAGHHRGPELLARAIQHETDHLDGVLFVDRLDRETRKAAMKAIREAEWFGADTRPSRSPRTRTNGFGL